MVIQLRDCPCLDKIKDLFFDLHISGFYIFNKDMDYVRNNFDFISSYTDQTRPLKILNVNGRIDLIPDIQNPRVQEISEFPRL